MGDRSKVWCWKEQYCIGTGNIHESRQIRSDQTGDGKNEHRHFRISELKWTGMGEFSSDDHYIYYCGQESLRRNGVAIIVNKSVQNAVLGCTLKNHRMISVHFQGKPFTITVNQVYAPTSNTEEAEVEWFYEDLQDLLELTSKKRCLFHYRGLECKSRKSRNTCCCCCCWVTSVVSDSVPPQRRQPTRLPRPWDSPGKNTGVGCHFLLQCMKVKSESEVAQSCPVRPFYCYFQSC